MDKYQEIDGRIEPILRDMEKTGIPFFEKRLLRRIHKGQKTLADKKQQINRTVGFMVDLESSEDRVRAIQTHGNQVSHLPPEDCAGAGELFAGKLEDAWYLSHRIRDDQRIHALATANQGMGKGFSIYPCYRIGDMGRVVTYGEMTLKETTCSLRKIMGAPGHILVKASYIRPELRVLQILSGDPNMEADLEGDPDWNLAVRLFGEENVSPSHRRVARTVTQVCLAGGGPEDLVSKINAFCKLRYEGLRSFLERAEIFLIQWRNCYPECAEFLDDLARVGENSAFILSYFGRRGRVIGEPWGGRRREGVPPAQRREVQFPIKSTAIDLAKSGFADLYEDYRFQHLMKRGSILVLLSRSIILMVERGVDIDALLAVLTENLTNANPDFHLDVRLRVGTSLGQLL